MTGPELSRRDVLKASALASASALLGWYIPGAPPRVVMGGDTSLEDPAAIPADANEVVMTFGVVVAAEATAVLEHGAKEMRDLALERLHRAMPSPPEIEGWIAAECIRSSEHETPPGGDHWDPLSEHRLYGLKQEWRMVRA